MNDNAPGAALERFGNETMAIEALTLEGDENRSFFYLSRIRRHFAENLSVSRPNELSAGGREDFILHPGHNLSRGLTRLGKDRGLPIVCLVVPPRYGEKFTSKLQVHRRGSDGESVNYEPIRKVQGRH
jgi:hypothetical protein